MKSKLLDFNIEEFLKTEKLNYLENIKIFKRQKIIEQLILLTQVFIIYGTIFSVAYFPYFKKNVIPSIGIVLVGISLILLLKKLALNNICFYEFPKEKYEFQFMQAILENKEISSAEIVYDTISLSHSLKVEYSDTESNKNCSEIKIDIQERYDIDEVWYDLSRNTLYVPKEKINSVKYRLKIPIETTFTENINLRNTLEK